MRIPDLQIDDLPILLHHRTVPDSDEPEDGDVAFCDAGDVSEEKTADGAPHGALCAVVGFQDGENYLSRDLCCWGRHG